MASCWPSCASPPAAFLPRTGHAPPADLQINSNGQMYLFGAAEPLWVGLGGISYQQGT
jgi:hypothetical protein